MKVLILAGGLGTRLSEATHRIPKPMVEIGGYPILWHIMKLYAEQGFDDFVVLLGYKGFLIKQFFADYFLYRSDVRVDLATNTIENLGGSTEKWKVTLLETGLNTMTGGRIKRAAKYIGNEPFMLTYGDGVADVDLRKLNDFHSKQKRLLTMTSIQPDGRFGVVESDSNNIVTAFKEKPKGDGHWINGGFFVCQPEVLQYIPDSDKCIFEREPLQDLAAAGQIASYQHTGFWQCMDTLRDHTFLNELWDGGNAPWKNWE